MADYQKMYKILFNAVTDCIGILQETQVKTEELYVSTETVIKMINNKNKNEIECE